MRKKTPEQPGVIQEAGMGDPWGEPTPILIGERQTGAYRLPDGRIVIESLTSDDMKQVREVGSRDRSAAQFYVDAGVATREDIDHVKLYKEAKFRSISPQETIIRPRVTTEVTPKRKGFLGRFLTRIAREK